MIKRKTPLQKEKLLLEKQEKRYLEQRQKQNDSKLNKFLEDKVPDKLQETLEKAFCSAFRLIFLKGISVIEKTYKKEELEKDFKVQDYANQIKNDRKSLKSIRKMPEAQEDLIHWHPGQQDWEWVLSVLESRIYLYSQAFY